MKYENDYKDLIKDGLYEESFMLLEKNISTIDNRLEQKKHIRDFFNLSIEQFNDILEAGKLPIFSKNMIEALRTQPFLEETSKKLDSVFDSEHISVMFSLLVLSNQFENAKFLSNFLSNKNIDGFPNTIEEVIGNKNGPALLFMCENLENIHYDNGELLRLCSEMPPNIISSLVDKYNFDINEPDKDNSLNLVHYIVANKNMRNYKMLVSNYIDQINWGQQFTTDNKQSGNFFDCVDDARMPNEFFSPLLEKKNLKSAYVDRIAQSLFADDEIIKSCAQTDVYSKLFGNPNFDPTVFNLEQGHFLYGLLGKIGMAASDPNSNMDKPYVQIADAFLDSRQDDEIPPAILLHIVGAAVVVASSNEDSKAAMDCLSLILRRYNKYINQPNPNGTLPISQVVKDTPVYRLLINAGAIAPEPTPTFWSSMAGMFSKKKKQDSAISRQIQSAQTENKVAAPEGTFQALRVKMREDFREMREIIGNELCDPIIKMRCENMFLQSDSLVMKMDKHNIKNAYEDVHFLSKNFSNYLKGSLESYMKVCVATVDFASEEKRDEKLGYAKKQCMEQVNLLDQQLKLISDNIFNSVETSSLMDMRVRTKFLQEKIENTKPIDLDNLTSPSSETKEDDVVSIMPNKPKMKI